MSSVLDKYLSGDNFTGTRGKKKIDVDEWIALHAKPVKEPVAIPEEITDRDSSIIRELRELQAELAIPRTRTAIAPSPSQKVVLLPDKNAESVEAFKARGVDTLIVWHPDILSATQREPVQKAKAQITLLVSKATKNQLADIAKKERRNMSNLLRLIIKKYLAENPEIADDVTVDEYAYFPVATNVPFVLKNQLTLISETNWKTRTIAHLLRLVIKKYIEEYERTHR